MNIIPLVLVAVSLSGQQPDYMFSGSFETPVNRVVAQSESVLLTQAGDSYQLTAEVVDTDGLPVGTAVSWVSSDPSAVSVDAQGRVTALTDLGSAV
ncbi:MAG: Ig-like domain-containing protein, partial [Xanthomonadales bacterium]|nr:Ig-like domain-containing protein [Xanthomonadales bacterium]